MSLEQAQFLLSVASVVGAVLLYVYTSVLKKGHAASELHQMQEQIDALAQRAADTDNLFRTERHHMRDEVNVQVGRLVSRDRFDEHAKNIEGQLDRINWRLSHNGTPK